MKIKYNGKLYAAEDFMQIVQGQDVKDPLIKAEYGQEKKVVLIWDFTEEEREKLRRLSNGNTVITPETATLFNSQKLDGYKAGDVVSFINELSPDPKFHELQLYIAETDIAYEEFGVPSPEEVNFWLFRGKEIVEGDNSTAIGQVLTLTDLRNLSNINPGDTVDVTGECKKYRFNSTSETGIKPLSGEAGSWHPLSFIQPNLLLMAVLTKENDGGGVVMVNGSKVVVYEINPETKSLSFIVYDSSYNEANFITVTEPSIITKSGTGYTSGDFTVVPIGGSTTIITTDDKDPFDPLHPEIEGLPGFAYLAGEIVSYQNVLSADPQFQLKALYIADENIPITNGLALNPEETPLWLWQGSEIIESNSVTNKTTYTGASGELRSITGYKDGDGMTSRYNGMHYVYRSSATVGLQPFDNPNPTGRWVLEAIFEMGSDIVTESIPSNSTKNTYWKKHYNYNIANGTTSLVVDHVFDTGENSGSTTKRMSMFINNSTNSSPVSFTFNTSVPTIRWYGHTPLTTLAANKRYYIEVYTVNITEYVIKYSVLDEETGGGGGLTPVIHVDTVEYDLTPAVIPTTTGSQYWDVDERTLSAILDDGGSYQFGKELFDHYHVLQAGGIVNGDIVSVIGASGNRSAVSLTDVTNDTLVHSTIGMCTVPMVANNNVGRITKQGKVHELNTLGLTEGLPIYVHPTQPGKWTQTKPSAPTRAIHIGIVVVAHATEGVVDLDIRVLPRLAELTDVNTTSKATPVDADNLLIQDSADSSIWKRLSFANLTNWLIDLFGTGDGHGVVYPCAATVSFNDATRTLTIHANGGWQVKINRKKYTITTDKSIQIGTGLSQHFIWGYLSGGVPTLGTSQAAFDLLDLTAIPLKTVHWDGTRGIISNELHDARRNLLEHKKQHDTDGARYVNGLAATFTQANTFTVQAGTIRDEELYIPTALKTQCAIGYLVAGGASMTFDLPSTAYAKLSGGIALWDNNGVPTQLSNNNYGVYYVYDTNREYPANNEIVSIMGRGDYNSISAAQAAPLPPLAGFSVAEWKLIYRVIVRRTNANPFEYIQADDKRSEVTGLVVSGGNPSTVVAGNVAMAPVAGFAADDVQEFAGEIGDKVITHTDTTADKKHATNQIYNLAALVKLALAANTDQATINAAIDAFLAGTINTSAINDPAWQVSENRLAMLQKLADGTINIQGSALLVNIFAPPGIDAALTDRSGWSNEGKTITGANTNGELGKPGQVRILADGTVCYCQSALAGASGSATYKRNRGHDVMDETNTQDLAVIDELKLESGWNSVTQIKVITIPARLGTYYKDPAGYRYDVFAVSGTNFYCMRTGTPATWPLMINATAYPTLTGRLLAHDFTTAVYTQQAGDETTRQGQKFYNLATRNLFEKVTITQWDKIR